VWSVIECLFILICDEFLIIIFIVDNLKLNSRILFQLSSELQYLILSSLVLTIVSLKSVSGIFILFDKGKFDLNKDNLVISINESSQDSYYPI